MDTRHGRSTRARLTAGAVMLSLVALVALPVTPTKAAPASCPRSINVTDGSWDSVKVAFDTVCPGGTVIIGPGVLSAYPITLDKAVKVSGAGQTLTTITGYRSFAISACARGAAVRMAHER